MEERSVNIVVATSSSVEQEALGKVIDCRSYGSLNKLLRFTGYVVWFKANILAELRNKLNDFKIGKLTVIVIEECKTCGFCMIKNLFLEKTILQKLKTL